MMLKGLSRLAQPMLLALPPEQAHEATLRALEAGLPGRASEPDDPRLSVSLSGLAFPNPVGIAAGFDKDGRVPDALLDLGFGFAEVGTITPLPQSGNPKPRIVRLIRDRAVINRLGFNSGGHVEVLARLKRRPQRGIVGINVGANKDSADRTADFVAGIEAFAGLASYLMINISSPNTPGLRDLQAPAALDRLLGAAMLARERVVPKAARKAPLFVKIAPDMAEVDLEPVVERMRAHWVDGIAIGNTTLSRVGLRDVQAGREVGGLSGRPLFHRSTAMLARVAQLTRGEIPLIGIGGIDSGKTALAKIEAGASIVQLYTGLIFEGVGLVERIKQHLLEAVEDAGAASVSELVGRRTKEWAQRPLDH
jgi:dihydroorotate dehydrogenase